MPLSILRLRRIFFAALFPAMVAGVVFAQQAQTPRDQSDVFRISTELVQTGVMVFDKHGRFVEGLKPEQFELRVDGKPVPISFFEQIRSGSPAEERQLAALRGESQPAITGKSAAVSRGRSIIFFIDDFHLSLTGISNTREAVNYFLNNEMGPKDQVALASASGRIGFLQQFTNNKAVLRAALARLTHFPYSVRDAELPPMSEYLAIKVEHGDGDAINYYVQELKKQINTKKMAFLNEHALAEMVKNRAHKIVVTSEDVTTRTLSALASLMRSALEAPGRKLVFFISDGFYLDPRKTGSTATDRLKMITDTATRAGVSVYAIDGRGLYAALPDATNQKPIDPTGQLDRANIGEVMISQDGLNALAGDTGGRALYNTNAFSDWVSDVLNETSNYYLLAWRPESDEQKGQKFKRVVVNIPGRPDLNVRLPRGFMQGSLPAKAAGSAVKPLPAGLTLETEKTAKPVEKDLSTALNAFAPKTNLSTILSLSFMDTPGNGLVMTASMQIATHMLAYGNDGKEPALVDLAGVILNDHGKAAGSFQTRLRVSSIDREPSGSGGNGVIYNYRTPLQPGIYQVRAAARDAISGRVGSAMQWIEIPDLSTKRLTLSNLVLGLQLLQDAADKAVPASAAASQAQFSIDRRFSAAQKLNFLLFIYSAARDNTSGPDLTAQVKVFRNGQPVVTTPERKLMTKGMPDLARIPYAGGFPLNSLAAGQYELQVTITDRLVNTSSVQSVDFTVD